MNPIEQLINDILTVADTQEAKGKPDVAKRLRDAIRAYNLNMGYEPDRNLK